MFVHHVLIRGLIQRRDQKHFDPEKVHGYFLQIVEKVKKVHGYFLFPCRQSLGLYGGSVFEAEATKDIMVVAKVNKTKAKSKQ